MIRRQGIVAEEGQPLTLVGDPVVVGQEAPAFTCTVADRATLALTSLTLADTPPVVRVLSVVPSLDTEVCALQTARFDAALAAHGARVAAYTVSVDTPYAMARFCRGASISSLVSLSDYRPERSFGHGWGVLIEETGELARAVFVLDAAAIVRRAEVVGDLVDHPDYAATLAIVQTLLDTGIYPAR